jgi:hypothetical protein
MEWRVRVPMAFDRWQQKIVVNDNSNCDIGYYQFRQVDSSQDQSAPLFTFRSTSAVSEMSFRINIHGHSQVPSINENERTIDHTEVGPWPTALAMIAQLLRLSTEDIPRRFLNFMTPKECA